MPELIRESDPDVLLAMQAVNVAVVEAMDTQYKRLAQHIAIEVAKVFGGK